MNGKTVQFFFLFFKDNQTTETVHCYTPETFYITAITL